MKKIIIFFCMTFLCIFLADGVACAADSNWIVQKIKELEESFELPPNLLAAIVKVESDFQQAAVSSTRPISYGLAQITKDAAINRCGVKNYSVLFKPAVNLSCAATILQEDIQTYGSLRLAIAAYNAGTACVCDGTKYLNAHDGRLCNVKKTSPIFCNRKGSILNRGYVQKVEDARRQFGLSNN